MTSFGDDQFWALYRKLPAPIRALARQKYALFAADPFHPSLRFKEISPGVWSVRITRFYRAMAKRPTGNEVIWYWIGGHGGYDRMT